MDLCEALQMFVVICASRSMLEYSVLFRYTYRRDMRTKLYFVHICFDFGLLALPKQDMKFCCRLFLTVKPTAIMTLLSLDKDFISALRI